MKAEQWKKIKTLYQRAIETAPEKRPNLLDESCGGDVDLRREVEEMLRFHNTDSGFIEEPVFEVVTHLLTEKETLPIGIKIDNYSIVREIGRGGMGVVYEAQRVDGLFEQRVAVKIIKRGMDTDAILKRFFNERQILASLDHPNIARLLDGGTTEDSLPYLVMEYVEGLPIDKFCHENNLDLNEKLRLFRKVCSAVQFAHQNLVIHRDLKPSNILVSKDNEPKLLDFGIAKLFHTESSGETEMTETVNRLLTPEYASPEQTKGEKITTLSDVYSLGVLLSKLLRNSNSESRNQSSDLEAILQTALREESSLRYSSVEAFSEDIRRFLGGLPVLARKDSFGYRTAKFVRRNSLAVGFSALTILALIFAAAFSSWQAYRANQAQIKAEQRFNDVRKLAGKVIFDYHDRIEKLSGATEVRGQMLKDSLEYLDGLLPEAKGDVGLLNEIGAAYLKIGDAQGKPFDANAGDTKNALENYRKAEQIFLSLTEIETGNRDFQINLSHAWDSIGKIKTRQFEVDEAIELHRKSLTLREKLLDENSSDNTLRELLADTLINLGDATGVKVGLASDVSNLQTARFESLEIIRRALPLRQAVAAENQSAENLRRVANVWQRIGFRVVSIGEVRKDDNLLREGLKNHQEALQTLEIARKLEPENARIQRSYYDELMIIAEVQTLLRDFEIARQNLSLVQKNFEKVVADDPTNVEAKRDLINLYDRWGRLYVALKNAPEAIDNYRKAAQLLSEIVKTNSTKSDEGHLKTLQWWVINTSSQIAKAK